MNQPFFSIKEPYTESRRQGRPNALESKVHHASSAVMNCRFFKLEESPREDFLTRASCPAQLPSERKFFCSDELLILQV